MISWHPTALALGANQHLTQSFNSGPVATPLESTRWLPRPLSSYGAGVSLAQSYRALYLCDGPQWDLDSSTEHPC